MILSCRFNFALLLQRANLSGRYVFISAAMAFSFPGCKQPTLEERFLPLDDDSSTQFSAADQKTSKNVSTRAKKRQNDNASKSDQLKEKSILASYADEQPKDKPEIKSTESLFAALSSESDEKKSKKEKARLKATLNLAKAEVEIDTPASALKPTSQKPTLAGPSMLYQSVYGNLWKGPCLQGERTIVDLSTPEFISLILQKFSDLKCTSLRIEEKHSGEVKITNNGKRTGLFDIDIRQTKAKVTVFSPEDVELFNSSSEFGFQNWKVGQTKDVSTSTDMASKMERELYGVFRISGGIFYIWETLGESPEQRVTTLNLAIPFQKVTQQ